MLEPVPVGMTYHFFLNSAGKTYMPKLPYSYFLEIAAKIGLAHRSEHAYGRLEEKAWLYMFMAEIMQNAQYELRSSSPENEENAKLAVAISKYIDENIISEQLPAEIYKGFGMSEKSVYRLLKDTVGLTLKEMIDAARIEKACTMLQDPSIPAPIISGECGFSGEVTFYRRFRHAMGITPGEYRKGFEGNLTNGEIQDYLSFNDQEVDMLLRHWAGLKV
jgi:AraC-like DNA-binding protein